MARRYARVEDTGERFLHHLECDHCEATIKPYPKISESGWMKSGQVENGRNQWTTDYCPDCWKIKRSDR